MMEGVRVGLPNARAPLQAHLSLAGQECLSSRREYALKGDLSFHFTRVLGRPREWNRRSLNPANFRALNDVTCSGTLSANQLTVVNCEI